MLRKFNIAAVKGTAACLAVVLCLAASVATPAAARNDRVRVGIRNDSSYDIYRIFMSSTGDDSWGQDLLGDSVLRTGASIAVTAGPGRYDLKLVDEDGDACKVMNLSLYGDEAWRITDSWLLSCEFHR